MSLLTTTRFFLTCFIFGLLLNACRYQEIVPASYPQQILYMPAARNGVFSFASIATSGAYRFTINTAENKLVIPLSVYRGGVSSDGDISVTVSANADTVSQLISSSALVGTALLPADKVTLPNTVTIGSGLYATAFDLKIDLDYLRSVTGPKLAIAVTIASPQTPVNQALKTTLITLDPAILKPTADFTTKADAANPRRITFTNASVNGVSHSWAFGDGSVAVTDLSPVHTYASAGTYSVTLTTTGITGSADAARKTMVLTVP